MDQGEFDIHLSELLGGDDEPLKSFLIECMNDTQKSQLVHCFFDNWTLDIDVFDRCNRLVPDFIPVVTMQFPIGDYVFRNSTTLTKNQIRDGLSSTKQSMIDAAYKHPNCTDELKVWYNLQKQ